MLRTVYYGPHVIKPWCEGTGYLDKSAKSLKSYRSREPHSIWQSLQTKTEELGEYDLYICKYCFLYTSKAADIAKHEKVCRYRDGPPGKLVFEDSSYRILEVQVPPESVLQHSAGPDTAAEHAAYYATTPTGAEYNSVKLYLQSLSLFGHLFLDTKSICFCVDAFIFYVAIEKTTGLTAGFFSKERHSWHDYNLACIVIFPPWQQHGLGQRLIAFSYLLSRQSNSHGSPEKPLSKHGQLAYSRYWRRVISKYISAKKARNGGNQQKFTLKDISKTTGIDPMDLLEALRGVKAINEKKTGSGAEVKLSELVERR